MTLTCLPVVLAQADPAAIEALMGTLYHPPPPLFLSGCVCVRVSLSRRLSVFAFPRVSFFLRVVPQVYCECVFSAPRDCHSGCRVCARTNQHAPCAADADVAEKMRVLIQAGVVDIRRPGQ